MRWPILYHNLRNNYFVLVLLDAPLPHHAPCVFGYTTGHRCQPPPPLYNVGIKKTLWRH